MRGNRVVIEIAGALQGQPGTSTVRRAAQNAGAAAEGGPPQWAPGRRHPCAGTGGGSRRRWLQVRPPFLHKCAWRSLTAGGRENDPSGVSPMHASTLGGMLNVYCFGGVRQLKVGKLSCSC